jgi:hypothetical protein
MLNNNHLFGQRIKINLGRDLAEGKDLLRLKSLWITDRQTEDRAGTVL